ncbi:MAG: A/G-specific adenine glycosylase [Planctomycetes bacterium]|nr:A/G-specific adenine glycosylase [Planctomycetota bacterium]
MKTPPDFRDELLAWYDREKRALPWRGTRDPYAILVSEIMLQQTRVDTAIDYYKKFMARFPDARALARAPADDVLSAWAGLGYYRRARMLHAAAREIVNNHGGAVPRDFDTIKSLPGIGVYTAGAIASIAFDMNVPAVDGNVIRVLSRILAFRGDPFVGPGRKMIDDVAASLARANERPRDWTQALMELGAVICAPQNPLCLLCPVRAKCAAQKSGLVLKIPPPKKRRASQKVRHAAAVVRRNRKYLFLKREIESINAGLYEFPTVECTNGVDVDSQLGTFVRESAGFEIEVHATVARIRHTITFHRIEVDARAANAVGGHPTARTAWLSSVEARERGVTAATRKILDVLNTGGAEAPPVAGAKINKKQKI